MSSPSQESNRIEYEGRSVIRSLMQHRLNSLVQRGIMRLARRYGIARSSTEEVDAEMV